MAENQPYEVISAPFTVYLTTGTDAYPATNVTPTGGWITLGRTTRQAEGGVSVMHSQTLNPIRVEGYTGPVKATRTQEDQTVKFTLLDLRPENVYKHALGGEPAALLVTTYTLGLSRALNVREVKLLVRGPSPLANNQNCQYEVPRAVQQGNPDVVFSKGTPAGLAFEFMTLSDLSATATGEEFGRLVVGS